MNKVAKYWDNRYKAGGNSGSGSYNELGDYKARIINDYIKKYNIRSISDFGCGDGNQISLLTGFEKYFGFDVSPHVIKKCEERFCEREDMVFYTNINEMSYSMMTLSLDVLYHIIDRLEFEKHLSYLFLKSSKYVLIYSTNAAEEKQTSFHILHQNFTEHVEKCYTNFKLIEEIKNPFPKISSNFYLYSKYRVSGKATKGLGKATKRLLKNNTLEILKKETQMDLVPGTFNVSLTEDLSLAGGKPITEILLDNEKEPFELYPCMVNGIKSYIVLMPLGCREGKEIEIISDRYLKKNIEDDTNINIILQ